MSYNNSQDILTIWKNIADNGDTYYSGTYMGEKVKIFMNEDEGSKRPWLKIVRAITPSQTTNQSAKDACLEDDIQF